jgi:hypothetical protein
MAGSQITTYSLDCQLAVQVLIKIVIRFSSGCLNGNLLA